MIKRTLYFGNPAYLCKKNEQLVIKKHNKENEQETLTTIPIEDIAVVILDNQQITITQGLLFSLLKNNCSVISCDERHHPIGLFLPLEVNQEQSLRFRMQLKSTEPLKKQLWKQTITAKINNQALLLSKRGIPCENMKRWAKNVRSGDPDNVESKAANYYWKNIFRNDLEFVRDSDGLPPNNLLNYGYAILRAIVARAIVSSGLLPTIGIHHRNKYNAYCLADDIMEPYRPYVDEIVANIIDNGEDFTELDTSIKKQLLTIPFIDVNIEGYNRPLMIGVHRTTTSLAKCFAGKSRKIIYPILKYANKSISSDVDFSII